MTAVSRRLPPRRHPDTSVEYGGDNPLRLAEEIDAALDKYGLGNNRRIFTGIFEGELRLIADCLRCTGSQKGRKALTEWPHGKKWRNMTMTNASSSARGRRVKFTPQAIEKIKELVAEGLSRDEIANRLGVTVGSLQVTCSRLELFRPTAQGATRPMSRAEGSRASSR